ncbi:MAG: RagB/SusD family nutrient uptake outer membrane protein [Mangrovibacterium sp.]
MEKIYLFIFVLAGIVACNEEVYLKEDVRDKLTADNLYATPEGFEYGLNAVYSMVRLERAPYGTGTIRGVFAIAATDAYYMARFNAGDMCFTEWKNYMNPSLVSIEDFWNLLYRIINSTNTIIERAERSDVGWSSDDEKNEVVAQARCIRAWAYRHLTYCWGDVPLTLSESSGSSIKLDWTRSSKQDIWKVMEEDWLFAAQYLPDIQKFPGRLNKSVALHYLAELYLAMDNPGKAETAALTVVNNQKFKLITERYGVKANEPGVPFMDQYTEGNVFYSQGNTEVLWEFPFEKNVTGGGSNTMRRCWVARYEMIPNCSNILNTMGRGTEFLSVTDFAFSRYESRDVRGGKFAIHRYVINDFGDTVFTRLAAKPEPVTDPYRPSTAKWDDGDPMDPTANNGYHDQPYLRLAETYLLLAESQFLLGKSDEAAAIINKLRRRAKASEITAAQVNIDFILDERIRELLTEEHRRYTLLRLDKWFERTKQYNYQCGSFIQEHNKLYPLPQSVIDANLGAKMPQNPNY